MVRVEEYCFLECRIQIRGDGPEFGFGLVNLHVKGTLQESNLLSLRTGMVNPGWSGSSQPENIFFYKMLKHHIIQKIKHINNKEQHQKIKTMLD